MQPATRSALERGRDLFDRAAFFEAHEVWEEAWLRESGVTKRFLQGLIQIAAALHKVSRAEHPGGAVRLFDAGLAKLDGISGADAGLSLAAFIESVRACREDARAWAAGLCGAPAADRFPRLGPLGEP